MAAMVFLLCLAGRAIYDRRQAYDMMVIIDGGFRKMRYPAEETAAKHDRIVKEASRLFRGRGFENVTVAEVMKAAGLTHGAFYAHFASKEELQAAAIAYGQTLSARRAQQNGTKNQKGSYAERYLSRRHRDNPGDGCTMAALAQEVARSTPELKTAFERGFEEILAAKGGNRKEAIFRSAALIGGVVLARAVQDPKFSDEILESVRQKLGAGVIN
jgi:TetR/AcrR family transcriptional repressor of nem operon